MLNLSDYKKKIASRFIPIEGSNVAKDLPDSDEYVFSEKIDGNLAIAVVNEKGTTFFNRSGVELSLPTLSASFPPQALGIWAGELYLGKDRSRFFDVASAIANDKDKLSFAVFDAVHALDKSILERIQIVKTEIPSSDKIHPVSWQHTNSKKQVVDAYQDMVNNGKEGIVVYNAFGYGYKLKPSLNIDVTVVGYSLKDDGSGIRALLCAVWYHDQWLIAASVGGGFSEEDRVEWMQRLQALEVNCDIVMVANNKLAYKWVKPSIVIQIKCIEILNEDSNGTIYKENLSYNEDQGYTSRGKIPGVSLLSPILVGERKDKNSGVDTDISQITDRIELLPDTKPDLEELQDSIIIKREVYKKESKTGTLVRKFIALKTNKTADQNFSPYFLYSTDFSGGRKDPLQTEIQLAGTEQKVLELLDKAIEENVKKGWEKI